jgi:lipid-A-disaccharide synthase
VLRRVVNSDELAIMGIVEVGRSLSQVLRAFRQLKAAAIERSPDAVILVGLARVQSSDSRQLCTAAASKSSTTSAPNSGRGVRVRVNNIKRDVDLLLSILPFEVDWYKAHAVEHVEFVGPSG